MATSKRELYWVLRAQSGDRVALDRLLERLQGPLFGYISGLVGDRTLAEDVLQEVFLLICRKLGHLREPELFRSWAYRIANRHALRQLQRERRARGQLAEDAELDELPGEPALDPADHELRARLPELIAGLTPASRAVLLLHYTEEMSLREVAAVLDLSVGTVKSRLAYGLKTLRNQLAESEGA